jgi:hypothetical protein
MPSHEALRAGHQYSLHDAHPADAGAGIEKSPILEFHATCNESIIPYGRAPGELRKKRFILPDQDILMKGAGKVKLE